MHRSRIARGASFAGVALWITCATPAAHAEDPLQPGLNWVRLPGAESCLSASALATRVETRVGRMLFVSVSDAGLSVDGSVRALAPGWLVTLDVSDPEGRVLGRRELSFEGSDCSVIDDSITLVIAITLYPDTGLVDGGIPLDADTAARLEALFGGEPTEPDPASLPTSSASSASSAEPSRPPSGAAGTHGSQARTGADSGATANGVPSKPWQLGLDAVATAGLGQLPGVAAGGSAYVRVTPPDAWPLQVGLLWLPGTTARADEGSGQATFDLWMGSLALCPWQQDWLDSLALCAGTEAGRLRAEPERFASASRAMSDVVVSLLGQAVLSPELTQALHLRLALVVSLPLIQRSYTFQGLDGTASALFRMPQVAGRLELGLGIFL